VGVIFQNKQGLPPRDFVELTVEAPISTVHGRTLFFGSCTLRYIVFRALLILNERFLRRRRFNGNGQSSGPLSG